MLIFIKSINLSEEEYITFSGEEHDVQTHFKDLKTSFLLVQEDFNTMEKHFDEKFDKLIGDYREIYNRKHSRQFENDEEQEMKPEKYDVLEQQFLVQILPKIVFQDFLVFYDEYSYAVNERIQTRYMSICSCVTHVVQNIANFRGRNGVKSENSKNFENAKYLDLDYFYNKLENKLSNILYIHVSKIRSILYGCNIEDYEIQTLYKQLFYDIILGYKQHGGMKDIEYILSIRFWSQEIEVYIQNIIDTLREHVSYFFNDHNYLYDYHEEAAKIFNVSERRFAVYEKFLSKYVSYKNFPIDVITEDVNLFPRFGQPVYKNLVEALCREVFEHVNYECESNIYISYFNNFKTLVLKTI